MITKTTYDFDISALNVLYLNKSGYNILNWLALLLNNRIFAKATNVSIRSIQLCEQRQTNIKNAQYNHLRALAKAHDSNVKDVLVLKLKMWDRKTIPHFLCNIFILYIHLTSSAQPKL